MDEETKSTDIGLPYLAQDDSGQAGTRHPMYGESKVGKAQKEYSIILREILDQE